MGDKNCTSWELMKNFNVLTETRKLKAHIHELLKDKKRSSDFIKKECTHP